MRVFRFFLMIIFAATASVATAQGTQLSFGGLSQDPDAPVEIEADQLEISQADNSAVFTGNVVIRQGDLALSAPLVTVIYDEETSAVASLVATGGVTLVSAEEAAESDSAEYSVEDGVIIMRGNVLLAQGLSSLASEEMIVNLNDGSAVLTGRVRSVLRPSGDN